MWVIMEKYAACLGTLEDGNGDRAMGLRMGAAAIFLEFRRYRRV
jgi:hypothetical protein